MSNTTIRVKNGIRYPTKNGWHQISVWGEPYERGFAHGLLLADEIKECIETFKFALYDSHGLPFSFFVEASNFLFKGTMQRNYSKLYEEIKGISDGANKNGAEITEDELVLWNNMFSIDYALAYLHDNADKVHTMSQENKKLIKHIGTSTLEGGADDRCTAFLAVGDYTKDRKICCAHNSFTNFVVGQFANCVITITPSKGDGHKTMFQACAGGICSGTDFFITSNGFIGTETTIGGFFAYENRDPICCRIRTCMQYAKTLDDYVMYLEKNNSGDYANSWLIGDTNSNEIMRIELGLNYSNIEKTKNGCFIGFNAPYDARIRNLECVNTGFDDIRRHQGARKVRLEELTEKHKGKIDIQIAKDILGDHYDVYLHKENPCSRTCCSHYDLDDRAFMSQADRPLPYQPRGAVDGMVTDTTLTKQGKFIGKWGSSCDIPFYVEKFMKKNIQWKRFAPYLKDRPNMQWTEFSGFQNESRYGDTKKRNTKYTAKKTLKKRK